MGQKEILQKRKKAYLNKFIPPLKGGFLCVLIYKRKRVFANR